MPAVGRGGRVTHQAGGKEFRVSGLAFRVPYPPLLGHLKKESEFFWGDLLGILFLAPNSTFPRNPKTHTHFMSPLPIFKFQWNSQMGDMVLEFPSRHTAFTLVNVRFACTRLTIPKEFSISCKVFDPTSDSRCQEVKKMLNLLDQHISSIKLDQKCFTNHMGSGKII